MNIKQVVKILIISVTVFGALLTGVFPSEKPEPQQEPQPVTQDDSIGESQEGYAGQPVSATANSENRQQEVSLTLQSAILIALDNNTGFQISRLNPEIATHSEAVARAAFDPTVSASLSGQRQKSSADTASLSDEISSDADTGTAGIGLTEYLPTGTTIEVEAEGSITSADDDSDSEYDTRSYGLTITQALLRNRGTDVNLVSLRSASLDTRISVYELQGEAEALVTEVEAAYWDYILAERALAIYEKSLKVARQQVAEVRERIHVGKIAETELASAEAEAASRHEELIKARGDFEVNRLSLIRLLNSTEDEIRWESRLSLVDNPERGITELDGVYEYVKKALQGRADIQQARLQLEQGNLEVVSTRNGLLPKLDLFIQLGGSRYANSFSNKDDEDGDEIRFSAGLQFEFPIGNREAEARHRQTLLSTRQAELALQNMEQLIQVDVRSAYVDVNRTSETIKATRATRMLREKSLAIEVEKFRLGRSTTFSVAQAQRDMISSQIGEIEAIIDYRKALLNLYRQEGSLLVHWKIEL